MLVALRARASAHPVAAYLLFAFAVSWAVWVPMALGGAIAEQGSGWPSHLPGLFGPAVSAFVVTALVAGRRGVRDLVARCLRWRVPVRWYAVALSPAAFYAVAVLMLDAMGRARPDFEALGRFSSLPPMSPLVMLVALIVLGAAEEIGWRGFAVPWLQRRHSALRTSLFVGLVWAAWHVPSLFVIANYRALGPVVLPGFFLGMLAGSVLLTWLYNALGESVWIVSLWHGCYNLFGGTAAARGEVAAVVSTAIMLWALAIIVVAWRSTPGAPTPRSRVPAGVH